MKRVRYRDGGAREGKETRDEGGTGEVLLSTIYSYPVVLEHRPHSTVEVASY